MKRGKKNVVDLNEQKKVFCKYKQHFPSIHDLPSPCSAIISKMSSELQWQISPKALYLSIKRNFEYFFSVEDENSEDKNYAGSENKTEDADILITKDVDTEKEIEEENNEENFYVVDKTTCTEEGKSFNFSLDLYQWRRIRPISKCSVRMRANNPVKQKSGYYLNMSGQTC